jgi:hypothetical protein
MFDTAAIMTKAWEIFRYNMSRGWSKHPATRKRLFAQCLKLAWTEVKTAIVEAAKSADQRKAEQIARVKKAMAELVYLPSGMSYTRRRAELETELQHIQAA